MSNKQVIDEAKFRAEMIESIERHTDGFEDMPWDDVPLYALQTIYGLVLQAKEI
jgi:hypothetical protein